MLNRSPMLGMLAYEQQSLEARKAMVTKMGFPMVGLGVNYSLIFGRRKCSSTYC
jgi:hypothetical protein